MLRALRSGGTELNPALAYPYDSAAPFCSAAYLLPVLRDALRGLPEDARVLDLGCGNGSVIAALAQPGWSVTALDCSRDAIAIARPAHPDIDFRIADVTEPLDLAPAGFDAVLSAEVIEHILNPRGLLRNAHRALREGGRLVLTTPYHGYWKNLALAAAGRLDAHWNPLWDAGHIKFFSRATLARLLEETGFTAPHFRGAGRLPWLWKSMVFTATCKAGTASNSPPSRIRWLSPVCPVEHPTAPNASPGQSPLSTRPASSTASPEAGTAYRSADH